MTDGHLAIDIAGLHGVTYTTAAGDLMMTMQDCFADGEVAGHLALCAPAGRRRLAAEFAALRDRDDAALARATPVQLAISWGCCWVWRGPGLTCYGYVETLTDVIDGELAACERAGMTRDAGLAAAQRTVGYITENHRRGWRHGRGYSVLEPGGESGYSHVSVLEPVTREQFAAAAARGWQ
jgi:hypothetical protein